MKKGEKIVLEIENISTEGYGVGRASGFVVFCPGGLPGDKILARVIQVRRRYAESEVLEVLSPSVYRAAAACPDFLACGGCAWQEMDYGAQLDFKRQIVVDALKRIGGVDVPVAEVAGMTNPWGYRNKAVFAVSSDGVVGMYAGRSRRIAAISRCALQHPFHEEVLRVLQDYCRKNPGFVSKLMIRIGESGAMVSLAADGDEMSGQSELAADLAGLGATTFIVSERVVFGDGFITERIGGILYQLSAKSFFQVNTVQAKVLYDTALKLAVLKGFERVIDAHAGVGGMALYAAQQAFDVLGMDIEAAAVKDAMQNAKLNNISNAKFVRAAAEDLIPKLLTQGGGFKPDIVFLNPPRKGCGNRLLAALTAAGIGKIVYTSCDPATLARDVKILARGGFRLDAVCPVDMFPMTPKIETVCLLTR